jgi:hypothetical protein
MQRDAPRRFFLEHKSLVLAEVPPDPPPREEPIPLEDGVQLLHGTYREDGGDATRAAVREIEERPAQAFDMFGIDNEIQVLHRRVLHWRNRD